MPKDDKGDQNNPDKMQKDLMDFINKMNAHPPKPADNASNEPIDEQQIKKRKDLLAFDMKPRQVKEYLDRFVIKQDDAKRVLATSVCDHYNQLARHLEGKSSKNYMKQNVIILGPTGVGKTYLVKSLADLIGVPFVKADATKFSETGYVGSDVSDLVRELVDKAGGDIGLAECGMIYLDEADKIAAPVNQVGRDVSGSGVQRGLLKIMEETEIPLRNPQDIQSQVQAMMEFQTKGKMTKPMINTRNILFIVSGAFDGLQKIIEKRMRKSVVGFNLDEGASSSGAEGVLSRVRTEDFIEYGFEPEFIGRLPVRVVCQALSAEDLFAIMKYSEGSIINQYRDSFSAYEINIQFEDSALIRFAELASEEGTGARGLSTVCEKILRGFKYELPSTEVRNVNFTGDMVNDPKGALDKYLQKAEIIHHDHVLAALREYERHFFEKTGKKIKFDKEAEEEIYKGIDKTKKNTNDFLNTLFANYDYGLDLIHKNSPKDVYILGKENIADPKGTLDKWIRDSYEGSSGAADKNNDKS